MSWSYPKILAHRGGGTLAPENTLGGIRFCAGLGFKGVEFDVMLAGDGTPVLIHDSTLGRTTGTQGEVARTPYGALSRLDAGSWRGERWKDERIPTFAAAARLCRDLGLWADVEIKPSPGYERITGETVARMAKALWADDTPAPLLSSFSYEALQAARSGAPALRRGWIVRDLPPEWDSKLAALEAYSVHCRGASLSEAGAAQVKSAGYGLLCWTVNDPDEARKLLAWGVDCLVTDALDVIGPGFT